MLARCRHSSSRLSSQATRVAHRTSCSPAAAQNIRLYLCLLLIVAQSAGASLGREPLLPECWQMQGLALGCLERRLNAAVQIADERALYIPTAEPMSQYHQLVCSELRVMRTCFDVLVGGCTEQEIVSFLSNTTSGRYQAMKSICSMAEKPNNFSWMPSCASQFNSLVDVCFGACKNSPGCSECEFGFSCTKGALQAICSRYVQSHFPEVEVLLQAKLKVPSMCYPDKPITEVYPNIINELRQRRAEMFPVLNVTDDRHVGLSSSSAPRELSQPWITAVEAATVVMLSFGWSVRWPLTN